MIAPPATSFFQNENFIAVLYIVAFSLFIFGLMGLTGPRTAVRGNRIAAVGMAIAVIATFLIPGIGNWGLIILGIVIGTAIGVPAARNVQMTAMPQMVALFNGVGGGAVALIAWSEFRHTNGYSGEATYVAIFSLFSAIIGSVSFWGSNIAFAKLQELLPGRPISIGRAQQFVNLALLAGRGRRARWRSPPGATSQAPDDPAAVAAGRAREPDRAADRRRGHAGRDLAAQRVHRPVGGGGRHRAEQHRADRRGHDRRRVRLDPDEPHGAGDEPLDPVDRRGRVRRRRDHGRRRRRRRRQDRPLDLAPSDAAIQMAYASQVVIVPGYGMAVAQAQHAVREMTKLLEAKGVEVKFAIHPVAGRMPGHMNVLLAEADVPYDQLKEMDDINGEFNRTDVSLVIGANDVTNPDARNKADSPIYGMPILNVDESRSVIVLKRSMNSGFAGIDNPLFYGENTAMLFGDAKASVSEITEELKAL